MNEIKCPNCGKTFKIDEHDYLDLISQVKNDTFKQELNDAISRERKDAENHLSLEIEKLKNANNSNIEEYKRQIQVLQNKLENTSKDIDLATLKVKSEKDRELSELAQKLSEKETLLREKDDQINYLKDMKAKLSTKMVGESLEQYCKEQFDKVRALFPIQKIYFEKDNDASSGSKGDFILREQTDNDNELYSIMFEMKNENSQTATKHKNEDFFKELDKDRNEKKCEYAVLVSLLESDSDYYNSGIVDVSHKYNKMYVIRPQCFIPMITLIRNAALKSSEYIDKLNEEKNKNLDLTNFEERVNNFKTGFTKNVNLAKNNFEEAIKRIDAAISDLNKTKDALLNSSRQLSHAENKLDDLSIKKLSRGNPTITKLLDNNDK